MPGGIIWALGATGVWIRWHWNQATGKRRSWQRCPVCGWWVPYLGHVSCAIPNTSTSPNASGPLLIEDRMCRDCAGMFGGWTNL